MANRINSHVTRLHRYLPFTPAHDQIYEEYQKSGDTLDLPTKALEYLCGAVQQGARLVLLTGDAGHGKTYLCRRLIQDYLGYNETDARKLINSACNGSVVIKAALGAPARKPLRVFKDFSELGIASAAAAVDAAWKRTDEVTVVCANEGRLRAVLEVRDAGEGRQTLRDHFRRSFDDGLASRDGLIHIINLNYQSVAAGGDHSLVSQTFQEWLSGTRWRICQECDSQDVCPIFRNRNMLNVQSDSLAATRRARLDSLFGTLERLGTVITVRELLMMAAYALTGGLGCKDVHKRAARKQPKGWQHEYAFYNLLFDAPASLNRDMLGRIPVLLKLQRVDPGVHASRTLDEALLNEAATLTAGEIDILFEYHGPQGPTLIDASSGIDDIEGYPRNRKDRQQEAEFIRTVVRSLRRRAYFDATLKGHDEMRCLGFDHGADFLAILNKTLTPRAKSDLKNLIVSGLHTIQGLQTRAQTVLLHLVDPAFGKATMHAAIVARKVPISKITLRPKSDLWANSQDGAKVLMSSSVDWLERQVVLTIEDGPSKFLSFSLDLMTFDCISRAASGFLPEEFYAHDIRRITTFLARLAESSTGQDQEISLFLRGSLRSVSIDSGVIQVSGEG